MASKRSYIPNFVHVRRCKKWGYEIRPYIRSRSNICRSFYDHFMENAFSHSKSLIFHVYTRFLEFLSDWVPTRDATVTDGPMLHRHRCMPNGTELLLSIASCSYRQIQIYQSFSCKNTCFYNYPGRRIQSVISWAEKRLRIRDRF